MTDYRLTIEGQSVGDIPYTLIELQDKQGKCYAVRLQNRRLSAQRFLFLGTIARLYAASKGEM